MGMVDFNEQLADVICQHKKDGSIIPMKLRLQDDDGEYQTYMIKAYKDITPNKQYDLPSGVGATNHIWQFECIISVFNTQKTIRLFYNKLDNKWRFQMNF